MTTEEAITQLKSLIADAETHREQDGHLDEIFEKDIRALQYAIFCIRSLRALLDFPKYLQQRLTRQIEHVQPSPAPQRGKNPPGKEKRLSMEENKHVVD